MSKRRNGLTLIEVLIIVVMIGILLTIAVQKVRGRKNTESLLALQTDVRNARAAEKQYFAVHNTFGTLAQLDSANLFNPIPGHTVTIAMTANGYAATASDGVNPVTCTLTVTGGESGAAATQKMGCQ